MTRVAVFLVSFLILFYLSFDFSSAQEELTIKEEAFQPSDTKEVKKVEYELPYPGILPDNPLYFFKALRDRIISILIADPLKKAEFNLLQADKRLNSGVFLFKKNKHNLAESTISKGENYFEDAISKIREAKRQGLNTDDIARRLLTSSKKHQEILKDLNKKIKNRGIKERMLVLLKRVQDFEKQVDSIIPKK